MTSDLAAALAALARTDQDMKRRLLQEHVDDGTGRCRGCPLGGQRGLQLWPCTIRQAIIAAGPSAAPAPLPPS